MDYESRKQAWNQNKAELRAWVSDRSSSFHTLEPEAQDRLRMIIGKAGAERSTGSVNDKIRELFLSKIRVSALELFERFEVGQIGMKAFIKSQLTRKDSSTWLWIVYNEADREYTLVDQGSDIPDEYRGWIPTEMRDL